VKEEILVSNPCRGVERNPTTSRERVLSDAEVPLFWQAFSDAGLVGVGLQVLLLTGQRPGEVGHMRHEQISDGWWEMPGKPDGNGWPGTKNGATHRVWLPQAARDLVAELHYDDGTGFVFGNGDKGNEMKSAVITERNVAEFVRQVAQRAGMRMALAEVRAHRGRQASHTNSNETFGQPYFKQRPVVDVGARETTDDVIYQLLSQLQDARNELNTTRNLLAEARAELSKRQALDAFNKWQKSATDTVN
jgi:integrase